MCGAERNEALRAKSCVPVVTAIHSKSLFFDTESMTGRTLKLFIAITPVMSFLPTWAGCHFEHWVPLLLVVSYDPARQISDLHWVVDRAEIDP